MSGRTHTDTPLATIDVRTLNSIKWGPLRQMFPAFADDIELARYLKRILATTSCKAVAIEPHRDDLGRASTHIFDVFLLEDQAPAPLPPQR